MDTLLEFVADGLLLVILLVAGGLTLWSIKRDVWRYVPIIVMAGLTSLLVGKLMSLAYQPDVARPFIEAGVAAGASYIDNPGFPSDHALLGTVAVMAVYWTTQYRRTAYLLGVFVVIMCIGRVLALVHTPLDVVGGIVAGLIGSLWYKKLTS